MNIYILSDKKIDGIKNLPMIQIEFIDTIIDYSTYDSLIITSKNAVYSINNQSNEWKNKPIYAISKQTADTIKELGGELEFVGLDGHGDNFANEIKDRLKDKRCLYIRGAKVVSNLVDILKDNNIKCDEKIVYKTKCINYTKKPPLEKNSIIIFSSPSTIKCFFKNYDWCDSYQAVCIGNTTAKYLPDFIKVNISKNTSIKSCVDTAYMLLSNSL
ncbi:MAG: uroporphyrinogen-III synthase [Campylobacterota bacterium]|nr:uroporphyrinogen-III synthase [Campylobacterota bacterium]